MVMPPCNQGPDEIKSGRKDEKTDKKICSSFLVSLAYALIAESVSSARMYLFPDYLQRSNTTFQYKPSVYVVLSRKS